MTTTKNTNELFAPGLAARAAARIRRRMLDQQLADGANPADRQPRACRAAELSRRCSRDEVAGEIEQLVRFPDEHHWTRVGPHAGAIRSNRVTLERLAELLRSETPLYVRGLARLQVALTDGAGPFYTDRDGRALARELERIQSALLG
jgi:hypothetical protein